MITKLIANKESFYYVCPDCLKSCVIQDNPKNSEHWLTLARHEVLVELWGNFNYRTWKQCPKCKDYDKKVQKLLESLD